MRHRPTLPQRAARWSLLFAALLQFGIAVVGPSGHFASSHAVSAAGAARYGHPESGAPPPHDEYACAVCHSLASVSLPRFGSPLPPSEVSVDAEIRQPPSLLSSHRRYVSRARAPPVA